MFSKILGKRKTTPKMTELEEKILKMNLTEMKSYVNEKISDLKLSEEGLIAVLNKLISEDSQTGNRYLMPDDMDSKIKKALELVLLIAKSKKITVVAVELIQEFKDTYIDVIQKYDNDNADIYESRIDDAINSATQRILSIADINNKMSVVS